MTDLVIKPDLAVAAMRGLMSNGVQQAERIMLTHDQVGCPVTHYFGPGIYIRELRLRAGVIAIGHRQKYQHMNVLLQGRVLMLQNDGSVVELSAPMTFVGEPGRKMGYVLEDVVWQNMYATDVRDIPTLEQLFLDKSMEWEEAELLRARAAHAMRQRDRDDFHAMLEEYGFDAELVRQQSENPADQIPMPLGAWKVKTGQSAIQGVGIFLTADAGPYEVLGPARLCGKRTPLGRYTNHSVNPNAHMVARPNGNIDLVTLREIKGCRGGEDGEEVTIDYRQALSLFGIRPKGAPL